MTIIIDIRPLMGGKQSGVETYIRYLLKELFEIDRHNRYILFANASKNQTQYFQDLKRANVQIIQTRIPNKLLNFGLIFFGIPKLDQLVKRKLQKEYPNKADGNNDPKIFLMPDLRPVALSKKIKLVTVVHDLSFHHYPKFFSAKTRWWYRLLNPKKVLKKSDHIITVSEFTKSDINKTYGINKNRISTTHEGVEKNFCSNIEEEDMKRVREKHNLPAKYFLFLATLEPRKNLNRLIQAFVLYKSRHRDDMKLVLVGTSNPKIFSKLDLEHNPDLIFTGFILEEDKAAVFRMAEAFLYPSIFEGFGLPLVEAMKCGTPIITSNTSSMPEVVGNAAITVDPKDTEALANAMEQIQKSDVREKLRSEMKERIKLFDWGKCARETLRIIENVAKETTSSSRHNHEQK